MPTPKSPAAGSERPVGSKAGRPCVLVVEDDVTVGEMLCEAIEDDYEVMCVGDSDAALAVLAKRRIDVVLLDYWIAGGNGHAVAEQAVRSDVPIVWMTGERAAARGLTQGSGAFLLKPFSILVLRQALAKVLGGD